MRLKLVLAAATAALSISLIGATGASAATEFGDTCTADQGTAISEGPKFTIFGISSPSSPFPMAAPSAGVVTAWKLNLITPPLPQPPIPAIIPQTLKVLRLNPAAKTAQVIGESSGLVGSGTNTIPARIPIQPGDRLGLFGEGPITSEGTTSEIGTLYCDEMATPSDIIGAFPGTAPVGGSAGYEEGNETRVPAVAVVEPDVDNDGFGDETQDKCPQSAATSAACPAPVTVTPVTFSTFTQVRKGSVTVVVTPSASSPVTVKGVVKLGKGKKATLNGGTQILSPGLQGKFRLIYTKQLRTKLKALPPKRSLRLNVTVSGTSASGAATTSTLKVKLKGQAKP